MCVVGANRTVPLPTGVGAGLKPPKYLVPGTKIEVSVTGLGTLKNGVKFA